MGAMGTIRSIAVFCGSSTGRRPEYGDYARQLGAEMVRRGISLVYGGGCIGLMGIIADTVRSGGGHVTGILPEAMDVPEVRRRNVESEIIIVPGMHERKKMMYERSDAFIAMPGGIGTIEELSEIDTWRQLGYHSRNIGLLNACGYWDPFIAMLDKGTEEGFISESVRRLLIAEGDAATLLDRLENERLESQPKIRKERNE